MFGWPVLVHYCEACRYNTPVTYSSTVWTQKHTCAHCGDSSDGADISGRSEAEMNHSQHDELAQLFAQNMHLSPAAQQQLERTSEPAMMESLPPTTEKQAERPLHYVSTHYTGTAHVRPDTTSEPSHSPPPSYHEALMPEAMAETLRQHSIDPSALLPSQIHLFQNADYEQRLRLLELWRIAPPSYPLEEHLNTTWITTSVERETELARMRYEQKMQTYIPPQEEHMLDTTIVEPIAPIRGAGETPWPPAARMKVASIVSGQPVTGDATAEPYIVNGYAIDPVAKSTDPVYGAAANLWQAPSYAHAVQQEQQKQQQQQQQQQISIEDQYGMYEQIRNHADWERLNEESARQRLNGLISGMDEDMVM